jgi:hypothetical protein
MLLVTAAVTAVKSFSCCSLEGEEHLLRFCDVQACLLFQSVQGELEEKDTELSSVKEDRERLEKEMQIVQQRENENREVKGKGPGGMLHSALQQLQRELRREAVANEKLMVKAESLLKDGSKTLRSKKPTAPAVAARNGEGNNQPSSDADDEAKSEEEESEKDKEEQAAEEAVRCGTQCFAALAVSNLSFD